MAGKVNPAQAATKETEQEAQNQEPEAPQAQEQEAQEQQQQTFDAEYVKQLRAEAAANRRKLKDLEAKVKADEDAKLTEADRQQKRIAELEKADAEHQQHLQDRVIRYEVMLAAGKLGIVDPDAAVRLLDLSNIEFDEDGKPINVEKVLKKLIADKPYLTSSGSSGTSPTNPGRGTTLTLEEVKKMPQEEINKRWDEVQKVLKQGA